MGKTPKSLQLVITVDDEWYDHPKVVELREKGHTIWRMSDPVVAEPHLILSKNAWRWNDSMWPMLEITLKAARKDKKDAAVDAS